MMYIMRAFAGAVSGVESPHIAFLATGEGWMALQAAVGRGTGMGIVADGTRKPLVKTGRGLVVAQSADSAGKRRVALDAEFTVWIGRHPDWPARQRDLRLHQVFRGKPAFVGARIEEYAIGRDRRIGVAGVTGMAGDGGTRRHFRFGEPPDAVAGIKIHQIHERDTGKHAVTTEAQVGRLLLGVHFFVLEELFVRAGVAVPLPRRELRLVAGAAAGNHLKHLSLVHPYTGMAVRSDMRPEPFGVGVDRTPGTD